MSSFCVIIKIGDNMKKLIIPILIIIIIIMIYMILGIQLYKINGHSMNPTLYENEIVLTTKININKLKKGDLIALTNNDTNMIKRVIGLPNDVVTILEDGTVLVNGDIIVEEYVKYKVGNSEIEYPFTVPNGEVFVLGDNRSDSLDSRFIKFGTVKESEIKGKVISVIWKPRTVK